MKVQGEGLGEREGVDDGVVMGGRVGDDVSVAVVASVGPMMRERVREGDAELFGCIVGDDGAYGSRHEREGVPAIPPVGDAVGQLVRIDVRLFVEAGVCTVVHGVSEGPSGTNVRTVSR